MVLLIILIGFLATVRVLIIKEKLISPLSVFVNIWLLASLAGLVISYRSIYEFEIMSIALICLHVTCFVVGYLLFAELDYGISSLRLSFIPRSLWYLLGALSFYFVLVESRMIAESVDLDLPFLVRLRIGLGDNIAWSFRSKYCLYILFFATTITERGVFRTFLYGMLIITLILTTGRTFILLFAVLFLAQWLISHKGILTYRYAVMLLVFGLVIFLGFGFAMNKVAHSGNYMDPVLVYMGGGIIAFNEWIISFDGDFTYGVRTLNPILSFFSEHSDRSSIVEEFIDKPIRTNVYTFLRFSYEEFGFLFLSIMSFFIGATSRRTWVLLITGRSWLHYGVMLYIIVLMPFQDQVLSIWPTWFTLYCFYLLSRVSYEGSNVVRRI